MFSPCARLTICLLLPIAMALPGAAAAQEPWAGLSERLNAARLGDIRIDQSSSEESWDAAAASTAVSDAALEAAAPQCDEQKMAALNKAMAGAYKPLFYDNNFDYLCDDCWCDWWLGDGLKRNCLGDWGVLDIGGQYRARLHNERNMRGLGLTGRDDDFLLHRTRLFGNLEVGDRLRFYAEYIDAESNYENFPPRQIEVNRSDMQNLFIDGLMFDGDRGDLWLRFGRQELLNGNQRLISPLDWANTRRTFEGVKLFWKGENWDLDAFWTNPVPVDPVHFDAPDQSQEFSGLYASWKGFPNRNVDLYAIRYLETEGATPFTFNTFGARWQGSEDAWLWEVEGAYQDGNFDASDHVAGFYTLGGGRKLESLPWSPVLWLYYDWASGDETISNGFHHLFPLGHKYMGWMDLYGRRNLEDFNIQLTMKPAEKLTLIAWHHIFWRQDGDDVPYNITMSPFVTNPAGSQYLGQELDLLFTWAFHPRQELVFGYSHFWHGSFYDTNPAVPFDGDADFFYTHYQINF
jgi:alginate export protein